MIMTPKQKRGSQVTLPGSNGSIDQASPSPLKKAIEKVAKDSIAKLRMHIIDDPMPLNIFKPGARVEIGDIKDPIESTVIEVCLHCGGHIAYKVAWWNGAERKEQWLEDHEVRSTDSGKRQPIGFRSCE